MNRRVASRNKYIEAISLSEAFEKTRTFPIPTQGNILNFFDQASQNLSNVEKLNLLVPYWQAIDHYNFPQKQLTRLLKGLHVFLSSSFLTQSVRDYFQSKDALKIWHDNFDRTIHSLATDYLVKDLITFHDMGITPDHSFLNAFENNITIKRLTPELLEKVSEILAGFNCALNPKLGMELTHG